MKKRYAFPTVTIRNGPNGGSQKVYHEGMTLLDYFAGQALQPIIGELYS